MTVHEREETYFHNVTIRDENGTKTDPTDVNITITNPHDTVVVNDQNMTKDAVGEYSYTYNIPANATFGVYVVVVKATDTSGNVTLYTSDFVVYRWNVIEEVRRTSGINQKTIDDDDIAEQALDVLREIAEDIYEQHKDVTFKADPDTGYLFNGTNTEVRTQHRYLADHDGDGNVTGLKNGDISGWYLDKDYERQDLKITVDDAEEGKVTVTKAAGGAVPKDNNGVYCTYWTEYPTFNDTLFRKAIAYMVSHEIILRMTDLHRATAADLPSNQRKIELNLNRFEHKYKKIIEKIRQPMCGGVK
jgi:hypothetical protein